MLSTREGDLRFRRGTLGCGRAASQVHVKSAELGYGLTVSVGGKAGVVIWVFKASFVHGVCKIVSIEARCNFRALVA